MKTNGSSGTQIVGILKSADAGLKVKDRCREHGVSDADNPHYLANGMLDYPGNGSLKDRRWYMITRVHGPAAFDYTGAVTFRSPL